MAILGVVSWFPQQYAVYLFVVKAILGLIATVLLISHMSLDWEHLRTVGTRGQRMRYFTLLAYAVLVTGSSAEQIEDGQLVSYRHLGSMVVGVLLILTAITSMVEASKRKQGDKPKDGR